MKSTCISFLVLFMICGVANSQTDVINIGSDRELFVDYFLIDKMENVVLKLHEPRDEGAVFYFDNPWEGQFSGYCTIIKDKDLFRAYYRGIPVAGKDGNTDETTCIAESYDGINWIKPVLGLYKVAGNKENNVILAEAAPVTHNFSPFLDTRPGVNANERYKALGGTAKSGLIAYVSADGINWDKMQDAPVITEGKFDSQNVAFWSDKEQKYISYFRIWTKTGYKGYRSIGRAESKDFINWSKTDTMTFGDTPMQHLYTNQTHPYFRAPQIYIAIAARFMPGRQVVDEESAKKMNVNPKYFKDCSDAVFMTTRGGSVYDRTFMEGFIRPGIGLSNWVSRTNYPALNVVQTGPEEMSLYVNQDYAQPTAHLQRYSLRLDGFASARAPFEGGMLETKPMTFKGNKLVLNFATSAAGGIKVEISDLAGKPYEGFELENCNEIIGNEIEKEVTWNTSKSIKNLEGKPVRIRFVFNDADIFSFVFK